MRRVEGEGRGGEGRGGEGRGGGGKGRGGEESGGGSKELREADGRIDVSNLTDLDECIASPCIGGECNNTFGSFACLCMDGMQLDTDSVTCSGRFKN